MSITFWFSLFFAAPPSAHNACATQGTPLLEMRELSETDRRPATTTKIFDSGAWSVESQGHVDRGCFDRKELRSIRRAVQHAAWKTTTSPIACFAYDPNFTEYLVHGRLRFTERMCSGKTADFETLQAIDLVKKELAEEHPAPVPAPVPPPVTPMPPVPPPVTPMPPAPPPVTPMPPAPPPVTPMPPVPTPPPPPPIASCRAEGTPLFEIHKRSDITAPTSTTAIYASGAWTFQPIDKDGHAAALTTGCFDKQTTDSVRAVVNQSPWDTRMLTLVCRAYSPSFTEYYVHGQLEYTARMCGAQRLDEKSLGAIKIVDDVLAKALPKQDLAL